MVGEWLYGYKGGTGWTFQDQAFQLPQAEIDTRMVFDRPAAEAEAKRLMAEAGYADGIKNVDLMQRDPNSAHWTAAAKWRSWSSCAYWVSSRRSDRWRPPYGLKNWPTGTLT